MPKYPSRLASKLACSSRQCQRLAKKNVRTTPWRLRFPHLCALAQVLQPGAVSHDPRFQFGKVDPMVSLCRMMSLSVFTALGISLFACASAVDDQSGEINQADDQLTVPLVSCGVVNGRCAAVNTTCVKRPPTCTYGKAAGAELCIPTPGYACMCKPGFADRGAGCQDIDECAVGTAKCGAGTVCKNTVGSYECQDACLTNNGGCDVNASCTNVSGTIHCACKDGYNNIGAALPGQCSHCGGNGEKYCQSGAQCRVAGRSLLIMWGNYDDHNWWCYSCGQAHQPTCGGSSGCDLPRYTTLNSEKLPGDYPGYNSFCEAYPACGVLGKPACMGTGPKCDSGLVVQVVPPNGETCVAGDVCKTNNGGCDANAACSIVNGAVQCACKDGYNGAGTAGTCVTCGKDDNIACNSGAPCRFGNRYAVDGNHYCHVCGHQVPRYSVAIACTQGQPCDTGLVSQWSAQYGMNICVASSSGGGGGGGGGDTSTSCGQLNQACRTSPLVNACADYRQACTNPQQLAAGTCQWTCSTNADCKQYNKTTCVGAAGGSGWFCN